MKALQERFFELDGNIGEVRCHAETLKNLARLLTTHLDESIHDYQKAPPGNPKAEAASRLTSTTLSFYPVLQAMTTLLFLLSSRVDSLEFPRGWDLPG